MNTSAFASFSPVVSSNTTHIFSSSVRSFAGTGVAPVARVTKPARFHMSADGKDQSVPQGFTIFSEKLNGRAAMIGFILAVTTEAITGQGIVGQVGSLFNIVENIGQFPLPF